MDKLHWIVQGYAAAWNIWEKDFSKILSCIHMGWPMPSNWLMSKKALITSSYIVIITSSIFECWLCAWNCALHFPPIISFNVHASDLRGMRLNLCLFFAVWKFVKLNLIDCKLDKHPLLFLFSNCWSSDIEDVLITSIKAAVITSINKLLDIEHA